MFARDVMAVAVVNVAIPTIGANGKIGDVFAGI
jgi:hypothetical protein